MIIEKFTISGLYGMRNLEVVIEDNTLVLVAENGAGKSTLLRLLYLFLSKQWNKLIDHEFEKITAVIDGAEYIFNKNEYSDTSIPLLVINKLELEYPSYKRFLREELCNYSVDDLKNDFTIGDIESKYDVPISLVSTVINELKAFEFNTEKYKWKVSVLYLPTYRRIERSFKTIYGDINKRLEQHIRQLLPQIDLEIEEEKNLNQERYSELENDLLKVFETLWQTRDHERWNEKPDKTFFMEFIEFGMDDVNYRMAQILKLKSSTDNVINLFLKNCNKYLTHDKKLTLSKKGTHIEVLIPQTRLHLPLDTLSAGEKQIISLFSYLLVNPNEVFVIIDEPELSLSMYWQEMILADLIAFDIGGLVVATHSPFIVNDTVKKYTHGINEFQH